MRVINFRVRIAMRFISLFRHLRLSLSLRIYTAEMTAEQIDPKHLSRRSISRRNREREEKIDRFYYSSLLLLLQTVSAAMQIFLAVKKKSGIGLLFPCAWNSFYYVLRASRVYYALTKRASRASEPLSESVLRKNVRWLSARGYKRFFRECSNGCNNER